MTQNANRPLKRIVLLVMAFVAIVGAATFLGSQNKSFGDVRETTPKRAFLSGGARSEVVLLEISATLKQIDERLQRMEKLVEQQVKPKTEP